MSLTKERTRTPTKPRTISATRPTTKSSSSSLPLLMGLGAIGLGVAAIVSGSGEPTLEQRWRTAYFESIPSGVADHLARLCRRAGFQTTEVSHPRVPFTRPMPAEPDHPLWTEVLEFLEGLPSREGVPDFITVPFMKMDLTTIFKRHGVELPAPSISSDVMTTTIKHIADELYPGCHVGSWDVLPGYGEGCMVYSPDKMTACLFILDDDHKKLTATELVAYVEKLLENIIARMKRREEQKVEESTSLPKQQSPPTEPTSLASARIGLEKAIGNEVYVDYQNDSYVFLLTKDQWKKWQSINPNAEYIRVPVVTRGKDDTDIINYHDFSVKLRS